MSTPAILASEPTQITQGETVTWRKTLLAFSPASGWQLSYSFRGPGAGLDLAEPANITVDGDDWIVTLSASQTAALAPGLFYWQAKITNAGESYYIDEGRTQVDQSLANLPVDQPYDGRSEVKQTLDAIRAAIAGRATQAQLRRSIAGTMIEFLSITELLAAETRWSQLYNQEVRQARAQAGEPFMATIHTRFVNPGCRSSSTIVNDFPINSPVKKQ